MKNSKKTLVGKKRAPFKLAYLREIEKNVMLHATQPEENAFGLFEAPSVILRRGIIILEDITKQFKRALAIQLRAEKKGERGFPSYLSAWLYVKLSDSLSKLRKGRQRG